MARRKRTNRALWRLAVWAPGPFGLLVGVQVIRLLPGVGFAVPEGGRLLVGVVAGLCVVAVFQAYFSRLAPHWASLALDRHHHLAERLSNALALVSVAPEVQTPWTRVAIVNGVTAVDEWEPRAAEPLRWPRLLWLSVCLLGLWAGLLSRPTPPVPVLAIEARPVEEQLIVGDDLDLLAKASRRLIQEGRESEVVDLAKRFQDLIEAVRARSLDRAEAFRRLAKLERDLRPESLGEDELRLGLSQIARKLSKNGLARPVAEAIDRRDLKGAAAALRQLAEKLASGQLSQGERARLRRAMSAAAEQSKARGGRLDKARRRGARARRRLLKKKGGGQRPAGATSAQSKERKRRLKRLGPSAKRGAATGKPLDQLDRDLAAAAENLMEEMGQSAQHLQRGAQGLEKMAGQQLTRKQKLELKKQLEEMRKRLRQGGEAGKRHRRRLEKFARRARGKRSSKGRGRPPGSKGGRRQLRRVELPGVVSVMSPSTESVSARGGGQGAGAGRGSKDKLSGAATKLRGKTVDVQAVALDSGTGLASSEVVYTAAKRGFSEQGYRQVFTDYKTVAEEVLGQQQVPTGYESSVRRYFQLIRPRASE